MRTAHGGLCAHLRWVRRQRFKNSANSSSSAATASAAALASIAFPVSSSAAAAATAATLNPALLGRLPSVAHGDTRIRFRLQDEGARRASAVGALRQRHPRPRLSPRAPRARHGVERRQAGLDQRYPPRLLSAGHCTGCRGRGWYISISNIYNIIHRCTKYKSLWI